MALDRASVVSYLKHHTQLEAAAYFGVSERTIRRIKNDLSPDGQPFSSSALAGAAGRPGGSEVSLPKPLEVSQHTSNSGPVLAGAAARPGRFVPRLDHEVAGSSAYWLDAAGLLQRVAPGTTGAAWNALQRGELSTAPAPVELAGPDTGQPDTEPAKTSSMSGHVRSFPVAPAPVGLHNAIAAPGAAVRRYPSPAAARPDVLGWFLAASVGPLPLPAVVVFLVLLVLIGGL